MFKKNKKYLWMMKFTTRLGLLVALMAHVGNLASVALASTTNYGLDFPGNGSGTIRFKFTNPQNNGLPIYGPGGNGVTYIWRAYPRRQSGYYTTFFWFMDDGSGKLEQIFWNNGESDTEYGAHPWPHDAHDRTIHKWEIAVDRVDRVLPSDTLVVYDRWYTQVLRVWRDQDGYKHHIYYWDFPYTDDSHIVSHTAAQSYGETNPPSPALTWGDAPWNPGNEVYDGIIRGIQIYNILLSTADILSEVNSPLSTSAGASNIWYLNLNPTPTDISDKSGKGHHPVWVGSGRPALYTEGASTDTQAPTTPTNLSATAVSSSQINLSWTPSTDNIGVTGYRIYRCQGAGCTPTAQLTTVATNSYSNTGLDANTTYVYRVAAYDAAGNISGQSSSASAITETAKIPEAPTNLHVLPIP
jgi:hypothetical protein